MPIIKNTTELTEFAAAFLNPAHLGKMIAHYIVINETHSDDDLATVSIFCHGRLSTKSKSNDNVHQWWPVKPYLFQGKSNCDGIARRTKLFRIEKVDLTMTECIAQKRRVMSRIHNL
jgi:hypothetical protein